MSIRLRFTLLYNAILTITLAVFGFTLYAIQSQTTLNALKKDLLHSSEALQPAILQSGGKSSDSQPHPGSQRPPEPPQPVPFEDFSTGQEFQKLSEREMVRILDSAGNLVASPFGHSEDTLPLAAEGLAALNAQQTWWETATYQDQRLLIYSRPVVSDGQVIYILQVARPLTERNRSLQALGTTLVAASLITLLVAFGVGWAFSGITLQPIQRITQTAQQIGSERDFSRRVDYTGPPDEVGQLATTFNTMLSQLHDAYQKVAHSLEMQRDFVADVSHELRTPLTTLRGNLGLLRRTPPIPAEEQTDILSDMVDESDRLIRLVNDLLVLARADAGRSFAKEPFDLFPLLDETCRQARTLDSQRAITLNASPDLALCADRDALKQVLLILLDNALKHSTGEIHVTAQQQGAYSEIRVQDHGEGIAPDKLAHVFDRFYRVEDRNMLSGFGLGLPIARALVEGQGGTISMQSEVGRGSVVILNFPC
jgi:signal transduction histidine kinase